jgi:hypothetical protein
MDDYDDREAAEAFDWAMQCKDEEIKKLKDRVEQLEKIMIWVRGTVGHDHPAKKVIRVALGERQNGTAG